MYSTHYKDWFEEAVSLYKELNEVLAPLRTQRMVEHKRHEGGVVEVRYENGTSILINYTDQAVDVNGVLVEPQNYAVGVAGHENEIVPDSEKIHARSPFHRAMADRFRLLFAGPLLQSILFSFSKLNISPQAMNWSRLDGAISTRRCSWTRISTGS